MTWSCAVHLHMLGWTCSLGSWLQPQISSVRLQTFGFFSYVQSVRNVFYVTMWAAFLPSCLYSFSVSHQHFPLTTSRLYLPSHITNTNTQWAAISDAPPVSPLLFPPVVLLQSHLLRVRPSLLAAMITWRLWRRAAWQGLLEEGRGFGFGHFVEEGEIGHIFPRGGQGDDGGELVAPEDLIREVGCSDLTGGGGRLDRGAHDHQQLKVSQVWVCPATTWRKEETWG